jgi:NADP-dependent 3-hydroxy acid dehydrogenase YdfG
VDIETTQSLLSRIEPFDILVNSAGMARHAPATDTSVTDFDAVVAINLRGFGAGSCWSQE